MQVYQPEDVHLIRDILNLEYEPLNSVLKVESLKPERLDRVKDLKSFDDGKSLVNTSITPMGRPINTHPLIRWKPFSIKASREFIKEKDEVNKNSELE